MQSFGSVPWLGLAAEHGFFYRWGTAAPAFADPVWETLGMFGDDCQPFCVQEFEGAFFTFALMPLKYLYESFCSL